jgi:16S rRNA (cytosine1402-N4)-methyltransferase
LHVPVLLNEVMSGLHPESPKIYVDGTLGSGSYTRAILEASSPDGKVIGTDLDEEAIERCKAALSEFGDRFIPVHSGFHDVKQILERMHVPKVDGIVLDLGISSEQLDSEVRGFSFRFDAPLDMRFDRNSGSSALEFMKRLSTKELEDILFIYGEERYSRRIARGILQAVQQNKVQTTFDLVGLVEKLLGGRRGKIHPATRTMQALRIAVNKEMENLSQALEEFPDILNENGRLCIVSYHSLEDRAVKHAFRLRHKTGSWKIITPKPITPSPEEKRQNPRSRSGKLRILEAGKRNEGKSD